MPKGYEDIKKSMKKSHPSWSAKKIKKVASMTWNKQMAGTGKTVGRGRA